MTDSKRVAIYTRVSTPDQTVDNQLAELRQAAERHNWTITAEYTDVASGAKVKRPGLDALVLAIKRREVDAVAVSSLDRLGRNLRHVLEVIALLEAKGIEFFEYRHGVDTSTPVGRFFT